MPKATKGGDKIAIGIMPTEPILESRKFIYIQNQFTGQMPKA